MSVVITTATSSASGIGVSNKRDAILAAVAADEGVRSRFFSHVRVTSSCWFWTSTRLPSGYGVINVGGRKGGIVLAHRLSLAIAGWAVSGGVVLHRCDTPNCVNPAHLRLGTQAENVRDCAAKGRLRKSARQVKLSNAAVCDIRSSREPNVTLANRYGVHASLISRIRAGLSRTRPVSVKEVLP